MKFPAYFFRFILITCLLSFYSTTQANVPYTVTFDGSDTYTIKYESGVAGKVRVTVYDHKRTVVFTEVIGNASSFSRPYNFSGLATGEYTIEIEDATGKHEQVINHTTARPKTTLRFPRISTR
ncbi:MAG: hypothetical protein KF687_11505 [Cyclobacteriaceae bacterium]|nr:hypothetical protein [Cyclobacteriaceae bacterium]